MTSLYRGWSQAGVDGPKIVVMADSAHLHNADRSGRVPPVEFNYGYIGTGPHALASSIIFDECLDKVGWERATEISKDVSTPFMEDIISRFPRPQEDANALSDRYAEWTLASDEIGNWFLNRYPDLFTEIYERGR